MKLQSETVLVMWAGSAVAILALILGIRVYLGYTSIEVLIPPFVIGGAFSLFLGMLELASRFRR